MNYKLGKPIGKELVNSFRYSLGNRLCRDIAPSLDKNLDNSPREIIGYSLWISLDDSLWSSIEGSLDEIQTR